MLLLLEGSSATVSSFFGSGSGLIAFKSVACTGSERRLIDCTSSAAYGCTHIHDVGVKCILQTGSLFNVMHLPIKEVA